jgi:hypothetical protein
MVYKKKTKKKRRETKKRQKIYRKNTKRKFRGGAGRVNVYELLWGLPLNDEVFFKKFEAYAKKKPVIKFYSSESSDDTIEIAGAIIFDETKTLVNTNGYEIETIFIDKENIKYLVCADLLKEYEPDQLKNGIDLLELREKHKTTNYKKTNCKTSNDKYKECVKEIINNFQPHVQPHVQPQVQQQDDQILQSRLDKICTENDRYCSDTKSIYSWAKGHFNRTSLKHLFELKGDNNVDEIIKALCKDILSKIDDRIQYKQWFLENCLKYYREIDYDNDDKIIEKIQLLYVTTKLKELNEDNNIILDWAIDNLKSNTCMFNYLLNTDNITIENFKYIIKSCFLNVHCTNLDTKEKDWFILISSDNFFSSILFEEEDKCGTIQDEYQKYLTSLEKKKKQEEEKKRKQIITTYKDKTIEELLILLDNAETKKNDNESIQGHTSLPSIKEEIKNIKTAIVSR